MLKKLLYLILGCSFAITALSQTGRQEADLKAVFIYNFTKYIDWDVNNRDDNFVIGIIGSSPVTRSLTEIAKTNKIHNKKIIIQSFSKPEEIANCQLLFIAGKNPFPLFSILDKCGKGVLTVSEEEGYSKQGTAFNFVIINNKLKFEANLKAIYSAGLKAGSQLLKLAIIVD